MNYNYLSKILLISFCLIVNSSCSVIMAIHGQEPPNFDHISTKHKKADAQLQLGFPLYSKQNNDKTHTSYYKYQLNNEPNTQRALTHLILDLASSGGWELIATPFEYLVVKNAHIAITYDENDNIINIHKGKKHKIQKSFFNNLRLLN